MGCAEGQANLKLVSDLGAVLTALIDYTEGEEKLHLCPARPPFVGYLRSVRP